MPSRPNTTSIRPNQYPNNTPNKPITISDALRAILYVTLNDLFLNRNAANGGIKNNATIIDAVNAIVLVNAKGLNNFPSAPIIVNTGIKLIIVVNTAVTIAPETSAVAL